MASLAQKTLCLELHGAKLERLCGHVLRLCCYNVKLINWDRRHWSTCGAQFGVHSGLSVLHVLLCRWLMATRVQKYQSWMGDAGIAETSSNLWLLTNSLGARVQPCLRSYFCGVLVSLEGCNLILIDKAI